MMIKQFDEKMIKEVVKLWNKTTKDEIFKSYTEESFINNFINNPYFKYEGCKVIIKEGKIIGFGNAVYTDNNNQTPGFITCIVIDESYQNQGLGSLLLKELENYLLDSGKTFIRQLFLNPIKLEWIVPGTKNSNHPGTPAVAFNSTWYFFLINNGYVIGGDQQDAFYQNIENFELDEKIIKRNIENSKKGFNITFYDKNKHYGFDELFKALNNPSWGRTVANNLAKEKPLPMLIVEKEGEILGWTGPLTTEKSGRGYFAGIGVHPKTQGMGLGRSLFNELILQSKNNGAKFMTLFTGSTNPARNIYLGSGFKIVQSFAVLRKDLR